MNRNSHLSAIVRAGMLFFALVVPGLTEATEPPVEILPLKVFRKLQAGGKQTVVVYGTSVSIGGEWAQAVRDYFEARFPGQVTFINQAVSGKHSRWGLEQLDERVIAVKPDLLFLEFAINDAATKHGISTEACASNLDAMVQRVRAAHPSVEIVLQTMNAAWDSPVSAPKKYASDRPQLADYYAVYRRYAQDQGLPLLDHFPVWNHILLEEPARYQAMVPDGIHPGKEASLAVAWPPIERWLEAARQLAKPITVWPEGAMPGHAASEPESERPSTDGVQRISHIGRPTLTLFPAREQGGPAPAMIVCPGGGYEYVTYDKEGTEIAEWLNSLGISALVLKYRVPNNRAGALQDLQRSLSLVRAQANAWNIDPNRLGVIGFSAGGHLAAKANDETAMRAYEPVDEVDQQLCLPDFTVLVYPAYLEQGGALASDLTVTAGLSPTLIVHSDDDHHFVAGSRVFAAALAQEKVAHSFLCYPTGGHGYGLRSRGAAREWPSAAADWFNEIVQHEKKGAHHAQQGVQ